CCINQSKIDVIAILLNNYKIEKNISRNSVYYIFAPDFFIKLYAKNPLRVEYATGYWKSL
ncbi:hypothetical protein, partial [Treponema sp. R6D11]